MCMIKIYNLDFVLFDFDDTLCILSRSGHPDPETYNKEVIKETGMDWWDRIGCKDNRHMKEFIKELEQKGIKMGLISQTSSYIHALRKNEWVKAHYGCDLLNFSVMNNRVEAKTKMMIAISNAYNIRRDRILLVDDKEAILSQAISYGFQAASPMEVVNYMENKNDQD